MAQDTNRTSLLSEYDESLMVDRYFIPIPRDGFLDEDEAVGKESERFEPLRTVWLVVLYSVLVWTYIIVYSVYLLLTKPWGSSPKGDDDRPIIIAAAAHVPLLLVAAVMEGFIRLQHRRRQSLGYLDFYRQTRKLLPIPFQTAAFSVAAMLVIVTFTRRAGANHQALVRYYVFAVAVVEGLVLLAYDVVYIKRVLKHNRTETLPDAQQYLAAPLTTAPDTRRRKRDAVVDHQVEFIRCLQEQRDTLRAEVNRLTTLLGESGNLVTGFYRNDAEHFMVAEEQRMRAIQVEAETGKKERDEAVKLAIEKKEEAQRVHELLEGQNNENNRLRNTLAEWSRKHAKLEHKLEEAEKKLKEAQAELERATRVNSLPGGVDEGI